MALYAVIYPNAWLFQEVQENLFRVMDVGDCVVCGMPTEYLDYSVKERPKYFCGSGCFVHEAKKVYPDLFKKDL